MTPDQMWELVRTKRDSLNWSNREVARTVGIYPSVLTRLSRGKNPDLHHYNKLAEWVGASEQIRCIHDWQFAYHECVRDGNYEQRAEFVDVLYCRRCAERKVLPS